MHKFIGSLSMIMVFLFPVFAFSESPRWALEYSKPAPKKSSSGAMLLRPGAKPLSPNVINPRTGRFYTASELNAQRAKRATTTTAPPRRAAAAVRKAATPSTCKFNNRDPIVVQCKAEHRTSGDACRGLIDQATTNCIIERDRARIQDSMARSQVIDRAPVNVLTDLGEISIPPADLSQLIEPINLGMCSSGELSELQAARSACEQASTQATSQCDESRNGDMNNAANLGTALNQGLQAGASIAGSCSGVQNYGAALDNALTSYANQCSGATQSCQNACAVYSQKIEEFESTCINNETYTNHVSSSQIMVDRCEGLSDRTGIVQGQQNQGAESLATAMNCTLQSASTSTGGAAALPCATNPTSAACLAAVSGTDCSNATEAASNLVCICAANPSDSQCTGIQASKTNSNFGADGGASLGGGTTTDLGGSDMMGDLGDNSSGGVVAAASSGGSGSSPNNGGGGGGFGGGGGGGSPSGGDQAGGYEGSSIDANILGGLRRGNGAMGAGSNGRMPQYGAGRAGAQPAAPGSPDLRKFLPGGQMDPRRKVAGVTGADGITGPHGSIFEKVTTRYRWLEQSLLP